MGLASKLAVTASASSTEDDSQKQLEEKSAKIEDSAQSFDANDSMQRKLEEKWISSSSMHFRDSSDREKFFFRNAEAPNKILRYQPLMNTTIDPLHSNTRPDSHTRGPPSSPLPNPQVIGPPPFRQHPSPFAPPPPPPPSPPVIEFANEPTLVQPAGLVPIHYSGDTALCSDHLFRILLLERHIFLTFHGPQVVEFDKYQWLFWDGNFEVWYEKPCKLMLKRMVTSKLESMRSEHQQGVQTDYALLKDAIYRHISNGVSDVRHVSEHVWSSAVLTTPTNGDLYEFSSPASTTESAAELVEQLPWPEVVAFLNMLIKCSKSKQLVTDATLLGSPENPLLSEDYIILDQLWSQLCLPKEWSATDPSETMRDIGALRDEYDEKIQGCWSKEHGSSMSSYAIPSIKDMSTGRNTKITCSIRISKSMALPLGGLTVCLPCAAALLNGSNRPGSVRGIVGVISGSSGLSLTSLPTEEDYNTLRWLVRIFWAMTYVAFLRCSYLSIRDNRPIYLFCSLLLAAHFVFGFAGAAETTEEATKGILMFGPLVATLCAALVYIPFGYRTANPSSGLNTSMSAEDVEIARNGGSSLAPAQRDDGDGDLSLGWRVMQGMMGPVV